MLRRLAVNGSLQILIAEVHGFYRGNGGIFSFSYNWASNSAYPYYAYWVLLGAISKRFDTIVEFSALEDFISFERKGKNRVKRTENHKIKVMIEVDMVCEVV